MDKELTIQDLEAQADALLAAADEMEELLPADTGKSKRKKAEDEAPEKKAPPLDEKVLAGLPAAEQLQKSEKLRDLFAKGKQKGKLDSDEITEVLDELDLDDDGRERVYNSLDALGVDYISGVIEPDDLDEPPLEAIAEIEEEELVDPNDLVDSFSIDDPVRMYLKEIGKVPLLSADEEIALATRMNAKNDAEARIKAAEESGETIPEEEMASLKKTIKDGEKAKQKLAEAKGKTSDMALYSAIEEIAPQLIAEKRRIYKGVSPNVDFYSGFVYDMLGIPLELYTPLFAIARVVGWSAHRIEELVGMGKIIRPAYKYLGVRQKYKPIEER